MPKEGNRSTLALSAHLRMPARGTAAVLTAPRGPRPQRAAPAGPARGAELLVSAGACHVQHRVSRCGKPTVLTLGKLWEPAIAFPLAVVNRASAARSWSLSRTQQPNRASLAWRGARWAFCLSWHSGTSARKLPQLAACMLYRIKLWEQQDLASPCKKRWRGPG